MLPQPRQNPGPHSQPWWGGGLPRGTGSLWASQAQGLACRLKGGQHIPGLGLCWVGLGSSCASPGLIEVPGLGGQAAAMASELLNHQAGLASCLVEEEKER